MKKNWFKRGRFLFASLGAITTGAFVLSACSTASEKVVEPDKKVTELETKFTALKDKVASEYSSSDSKNKDAYTKLNTALNNLAPLVKNLDVTSIKGLGSSFKETIVWLKSLANNHFPKVKTEFDALMDALEAL